MVDNKRFQPEFKQVQPNIAWPREGKAPETVVASEKKAFLALHPRITVLHGRHCLRGNGDRISVEHSEDLPDSTFTAVVFLNGWSLRYLDGDRHIWGAGTWLTNSRVEGQAIKWQANGVLADDDFDDDFEWCYYYTVIAWKRSEIDLVADQSIVVNHVNSSGNEVPLTAVASYFHDAQYESKEQLVVLPRGFVFRSDERKGFLNESLEDCHLMHIAYNLTHSENFIEQGKDYGELASPTLVPPTSKAHSGFVSWETQAIFQDDSFVKYHFFDHNVTLAGNGVGLLQPPYSILNSWAQPNIGSGRSGEVTDTIIIDHLPFSGAVPILTGWDLRYDFGDQHVTMIGVWLSDIEYTPNVSGEVGRLRYNITSALYDKDQQPGYSFSHKVSVLGVKPSDVIIVPPNE